MKHMAKPSGEQQASLTLLRTRVLDEMAAMDLFSSEQIQLLQTVPLGVLNKNATQRHGVTRWLRETPSTLTVQTVDLHPRLLNQEWLDYAAFVMYHEFLHALGWRSHDRSFRHLESLWPHPQAAERGQAFTHEMRMGRAKWHWKCPECERQFPRQRRGAGRYLCRTCRCVLLDVPVKDAQ